MFFFSALQDLKEEIDIRLSRVQDIKYEPRLLAEDDSRLLQLETQGTPSLDESWRTPGTPPSLVLPRQALSACGGRSPGAELHRWPLLGAAIATPRLAG